MTVLAEPVQVTTPSPREVLITRAFNASRDLVWRCHTEPALVRRWLLGPVGWSMPVCEIDLRVGGRYRYEWANADGRSMGMGGVFRDIDKPARIVTNELFDDDWTGGETTVTQTFTAQGAQKTLLALNVLYASEAARDGAIKTGMTSGLDQGYARLDEVLASL